MSNIINIEEYKQKEKGETNSKTKQEIFRESLQPTGTIDLPNIKREPNRYSAYRKDYEKEEKSREILKAKKDTKYEASRKAKQMRRVLIKRIALIATSGLLLAFGGYKKYNSYKESQKPVTLEMLLDNGISLDELGIDEDIKQEIEEIKMQLKDTSKLDIEDIAILGERINDLQLHTMKSKIINATGLDREAVRFEILEPLPDSEYVKVTVGDNVYFEKGYDINKKEISKNIGKYIRGNIVGMQNILYNLKYGNSDREEVLKRYNKEIKGIEELAISEIKLDSKGNLVMENTKVSELENKEVEDESER